MVGQDVENPDDSGVVRAGLLQAVATLEAASANFCLGSRNSVLGTSRYVIHPCSTRGFVRWAFTEPISAKFGPIRQPFIPADASYPTVCIPPPPPDLDCSDISYTNFKVVPPDDHHFDGDGDGIGCET